MSLDAVNDFDMALRGWRSDYRQLEQDMLDKERIDCRVYDLYRNNDLMRGLIEKQVDTQIGSRVALQAMPDYEALGVSREEAVAWSRETERQFHAWAYSPENWISADRSMDFTQLCRAATRMRILTGETFASREWRDTPLGVSTCVQLISPHRIKTPRSQSTQNRVFHGVELDRYGAAFAYHVETARPNQKRTFNAKTSKRYARYNKFGWMQLWHVFEPLMPEYPRGISRLASVLPLMMQRQRYMEAELDKAIIAAAYVMVFNSDEDAQSVADALAGNDVQSLGADRWAVGQEQTNEAQKAKSKEILDKMIADRYAEMTGAKMIHTFKGESVEILRGSDQASDSMGFVEGYTKPIANGVGISYELGTGDFNGVSFAGGQMSLGIYEYSANIQRQLYDHKFARYVYRAWLDEMIARERIQPIAGIPYWTDGNREKYARCQFTGAKRVHVDPLKNRRSQQVALDSGTTARTDIITDEGGDPEAVFMGRANDARMIVGAIKTAAAECGVTVSDEVIAKTVVDVVATAKIDVPATVTDLIADAVGGAQED